jgi:hypothetical protein
VRQDGTDPGDTETLHNHILNPRTESTHERWIGEMSLAPDRLQRFNFLIELVFST